MICSFLLFHLLNLDFYWLCINVIHFDCSELSFQGVWWPWERRCILGCDRNWKTVLGNWIHWWFLFRFLRFLYQFVRNWQSFLTKKKRNVNQIKIGNLEVLNVIAIKLKTTVLCLFVGVCCCFRCSGRSEVAPKNRREEFFGLSQCSPLASPCYRDVLPPFGGGFYWKVYLSSRIISCSC